MTLRIVAIRIPHPHLPNDVRRLLSRNIPTRFSLCPQVICWTRTRSSDNTSRKKVSLAQSARAESHSVVALDPSPAGGDRKVHWETLLVFWLTRALEEPTPPNRCETIAVEKYPNPLLLVPVFRVAPVVTYRC